MAEERISGIYMIKNTVNNKAYIGQSVYVHRRWRNHKSELGKNIHKNSHLQNSWNRYGKQNFEFSILEKCDQSIICEREDYWIEIYKSCDGKCGYNTKNNSDFTSEETRRKISVALTGRKRSPEFIAKMKLQTRSAEQRKQISETKRGNSTSVWKGRHLSEEHRKKLSQSHSKNGELSGVNKLTNSNVIEIMEMVKTKKYTIDQIAETFNVKRSAIYCIKNGSTWSHVTGIAKKPPRQARQKDRRGEYSKYVKRKNALEMEIELHGVSI